MKFPPIFHDAIESICPVLYRFLRNARVKTLWIPSIIIWSRTSWFTRRVQNEPDEPILSLPPLL